MQRLHVHIGGNGYAAHSGSLAGRIRNASRRGRSAISRWYRYRMTVRALEGLSDRTLHDIGIDRSEISSVASAHCREQEQQRILRGIGFPTVC